MVITLPYPEVAAIQAFLGYLQKNYARTINPKDTYLIAAVGAWFHQESGGYRSVIGNNPFNIRPGMTSFMSTGYRVSTAGNGRFLTFASLSRGFEAAAYLLMHANKAYGYQTALNALKRGGNQAATDFLAALAMSSWDGANYGVHNWVEAYDKDRNHLLRVYLGIGGVQITNPAPYGTYRTSTSGHKKGTAKPKPAAKQPPKLPRDFNYKPVEREYLNPWAAATLYAGRHRHPLVDTKPRNR